MAGTEMLLVSRIDPACHMSRGTGGDTESIKTKLSIDLRMILFQAAKTEFRTRSALKIRIHQSPLRKTVPGVSVDWADCAAVPNLAMSPGEPWGARWALRLRSPTGTSLHQSVLARVRATLVSHPNLDPRSDAVAPARI